jgi:hypothetical protein
MVVLDWTSSGPEGPGGVGAPEPCVLCERKTIVRSPTGAPCHKGCAEAWVEAHPERRAEYEQQMLAMEPAGGVARDAAGVTEDDLDFGGEDQDVADL